MSANIVVGLTAYGGVNLDEELLGEGVELRPKQTSSLRLARVELRINQPGGSVSTVVVGVEDLKAALAAVEHSR